MATSTVAQATALLRGLVPRLATGHGRAVWITGEAGIGKSTVVAEAFAGAACSVFAARALEHGTSRPGQVLHDALDTVVGDADPVEALEQRCAEAPAVLVVDDAQWADEASLATLARLVGLTAARPLLLVVVSRPVPIRPAVQALRTSIVDNNGVLLELGAWPNDALADLVRGLTGGRPSPKLVEVLAAAGRNPRYLRELVEALARESRLSHDRGIVDLVDGRTDLPKSLPAAIGPRLCFLSDRTLSTLRIASVLGPTFPVEALGAVAGHGAAALVEVVHEAVAAGLVEDVPGPALRFRHKVVHHALYAGMPGALRMALHRQVAQELAEAGVGPAQVAAQLLRSAPTPDRWTLDWVTDHAAVLARLAPASTVELLERARSALPVADGRRDRLTAALVVALLATGDNERAECLARSTLGHCEDPATATQLTGLLHLALSRMDRTDEAADALSEAMARPDLPPLWSARLVAARALLLARARPNDRALEAALADLDAVVATGEAAGDRFVAGAGLAARVSIALAGHRPADALDFANRALRAFGEEPETADEAARVALNRVRALDLLGRADEADRAAHDVAAQLDQCSPPVRGELRIGLAELAYCRGRLDDALTEVDQAWRLPLPPRDRARGQAVRALVELHREDAPSTPDVGGSDELATIAAVLLAERAGDHAGALVRLMGPERAQPDAPEGAGESSLAVMWLPTRARLALAAGRPELVAAWTTRPPAADAGPVVAAVIEHAQGLVAGDPVMLRRAGVTLVALGFPLFGARALGDAALASARRADGPAARAAHIDAVAAYEAAGAAWEVRRLDAALRDHGIRRGPRGPRRRAATGLAALTESERRVAELICRGLSNRDIADRLVLSRYTVQSHVSHILAKLGGRSRIDIARVVADQLVTA